MNICWRFHRLDKPLNYQHFVNLYLNFKWNDSKQQEHKKLESQQFLPTMNEIEVKLSKRIESMIRMNEWIILWILPADVNCRISEFTAEFSTDSQFDRVAFWTRLHFALIFYPISIFIGNVYLFQVRRFFLSTCWIGCQFGCRLSSKVVVLALFPFNRGQ